MRYFIQLSRLNNRLNVVCTECIEMCSLSVIPLLLIYWMNKVKQFFFVAFLVFVFPFLFDSNVTWMNENICAQQINGTWEQICRVLYYDEKEKKQNRQKYRARLWALVIAQCIYIIFFLHRNLNTKADSYALTEHTSVLRHYLHFNVVHTMREKCFPSLFFSHFQLCHHKRQITIDQWQSQKYERQQPNASFTWFANNLSGKKTRNHFNQSVSMFWELNASKLMFSNESTWKFNGNIFTKIPFIGSIQSSQNRT